MTRATRHARGTPPAGDGRLVLRFALGAISLGGARLLSELRAAGRRPRASSTAPGLVLRHHLVGAAVLGSNAVASRAAATRARWTARAHSLTDSCGRLLARSRLGWRVDGALKRLRARGEQTTGRWARVGRAEEEAGRALVRALAARSFHGAVGRLGQSADLRRLVEEQSAGLSRSAVRELRELCARADPRIERSVRRLRRRH